MHESEHLIMRWKIIAYDIEILKMNEDEYG